MKKSYLFAIIAIVISLGSFTAIAQEGRTDDSQRRGEGPRRDRSAIVTPDGFKRSGDMVATGNYTLRCRGGNGFDFREIDGRVSSSGSIITMLEMTFSPSSQAAGAGLQPGQCALIERAFNLDELMMVRDPVKVRFETPANSQLKQAQHGSSIDRSPTAAESYPDAITIPVYLQGPDHYWTFNVTNPGNGFFVTSSHGVYKSPIAETTSPKGNRSILLRKY